MIGAARVSDDWLACDRLVVPAVIGGYVRELGRAAVCGVVSLALVLSAAGGSAAVGVAGMFSTVTVESAGDAVVFATFGAEDGSRQVRALDEVGDLVWSWTHPGLPAASSSQMHALEVAPSGAVYAGSQFSDGGYVTQLTSSGEVVWDVGVQDGVAALTVDGHDNVFVAFLWEGDLGMFTAQGELVWRRSYPGGDLVEAMAADAAGHVYAASGLGGYVIQVDAATGEELWRITQHGSPDALAVDADGSVYVGDWSGQVHKHDATGAHLWTRQVGGFVDALRVDRGFLYVSDAWGFVTKHHLGDGEPDSQWPADEVWGPELAVDLDGNVHVARRHVDDWYDYELSAHAGSDGMLLWLHKGRGIPGAMDVAPGVFVVAQGQDFVVRPLEELFGRRMSSAYAGDPVHTATGNFTDTWVDLAFAEQAFGVLAARTYNAQDVTDGLLGVGWSTPFESRLALDGDGSVLLVDHDGRRVTFVPDGSGGWEEPEELFGKLVELDEGGHVLEFHSGERWEFTSSGWLSEVSSAEGPSTTIERDADGRPLAAESSFGHRVEFEYDQTGRLTRLQAGDGRSVTYGYGPHGHLVAVTGPDGAVETYEVDEQGLIISITDAAGRLVIANVYDVDRRVVWQQTAAGDEVTFSYDRSSGVTTVTTTAGQLVRFEHDRQGRVVAVTDTVGAVQQRSYDEFGNLRRVVDRLGETAELNYDGRGNIVAIVHTDGTSETFAYDDRSRLVEHTDGTGAVTSYGYQGESRLPAQITDPTGAVTSVESNGSLVTRVTDPDGVATSFEYDPAGNVNAITDGAGETTRFSHDGAGRVVLVRTPLGHETAYSYDDAGRVVERREPPTVGTVGEATGWPDPPTATHCLVPGWQAYGFDDVTACLTFLLTGEDSRDHSSAPRTDPELVEVVWTYPYDAAGNLVEQIDPTGQTTTYRYDDAGLLEAMTDPAGATTNFLYDREGKLVQQHAPGGATTHYEYGPLGRLVRVADPENVDVRFEHDAEGRIIAASDGADAATTYVYDVRGRLVEQTDPNDATTRYGYDGAGRLLSEQDPTGLTTSYEYDAAGRLTGVTDPAGSVEKRAYTSAGRLASITDATDRTTSYAYDDAGQLTAITDAAGNTTRFEHDADGRQTAVVSPEGRRVEFELDPAGRVAAETIGNLTSRFAYDPAGRLVHVVDEVGAEQQFVYDPAGRLSAVTDALGGTVTYDYDGRGNRTRRTDQLGSTETWTYDLADRLTGHTDPAGQTTTLAYNSLGQLATITDPTGRTEQAGYDPAGRLIARQYVHDDQQVAVGFAYDAAGRRIEMSDSHGTTAYTYDHGRLAQVDPPVGQTLTYTYDPAGRLAITGFADGSTVVYGYDPAGQLATVAHPMLGEVTYRYDTDGLPIRETLPDGRRNYDYDGRGLLVGYSQTLDGHTTQTVLERDPAGRVLAETLDGATTAYGYDPAGQLTTVTDPDGAQTVYAYNAAGSRVRMTSPDQDLSYTYAASGQLAHVSGTDGETLYTHDAAGRRLTVAGPGTAVDIGYDPAGLPITITLQTTGTTVSQNRSYDGDGRLIGLSIDDTSGPGSTHTLTWDPTHALPPIAVWTRDGQDHQLVHGIGPIGHSHTGGTGLFGHDAHGSLTVDTADAGLVAAATYSPYGRPDDAGPALVALGWRGQLHTGHLVHLRARDYDPTVGLFTSIDPLEGLDGHPTVANFYHYAANDPINRDDPDGLTPFSDRELSWQWHQHLQTAGPQLPNWQARRTPPAPRHSRSVPPLKQDRCWFLYGSCSQLGWDIGRSNTNFWAGLTDQLVLSPADFVTTSRIRIPRIGPRHHSNHVEHAYQVGTHTGTAVELIGGGGAAIKAGVGAFRSTQAAGSIRVAATAATTRLRNSLTNLTPRPRPAPQTTRAALPAGSQRVAQHHVFPQQFRERFARAGVDIDDFTVRVDHPWEHLRGIHGRGVPTQGMPGRWNQRWAEFFDANPNPTAQQIYQFGGRLMDDFGLSGRPIVPYK